VRSLRLTPATAPRSNLRRSLRAFPTLLRVGFAEAIAYRGEFLIWILSTNMPIIMLFLWSAVAREQPVGRFGEEEFGAYFLTTLMVRLLTGSWVVWEMNYEIRQGTLARRLLRPLHAFLTYAAENLAAVPFRLLLCIPIAAATVLWLGARQFSGQPLHWIILPLAILGGWGITFATMSLIGTLGLYWESSLALMRLWFGLFFVFSGYTIPLQLFPTWLRQVVVWLPFRFQLSLAVEIGLGLTPPAQALALLGLQWLYAVLLLGGALLLWRRGLRRWAAFGG
jgi:ABC-2 type transport system permease protein